MMGAHERSLEMSRERVLDSMRHAFDRSNLADAVVLAVAKAQAHRPLGAEDLAALRDAEEFLESVRRGFDWLEERSVTVDSAFNASSFEAAARSQADSRSAFPEHVERLLRTTTALVQDRHPKEPELSALRGFFNNLLRSSLNSFDRALSHASTMGDFKCLTPAG